MSDLLAVWSPEIRHLAEKMGLTENDVRILIDSENLSLADIAVQIDCLSQVSLCVDLHRPCTLGDGIQFFSEAECLRLATVYSDYAKRHGCLRFVPASGAASRLFAALDPSSPAQARLALLLELDAFPFSQALIQAITESLAADMISVFPEAWQQKEKPLRLALEILGPQILIEMLLGQKGLNLGELPKALLPFHRYGKEVRTALAEQVAETEALVCDEDSICRIHFTVAPEHRAALEVAAKNAAKHLRPPERRLEARFSEQADSTRTLSLWDGKLVREKGRLTLRPGGHGALLGNLQAAASHGMSANPRSGALVFVKNIDNVVRQESLAEGVRWRSALAGLLLETETQVHDLLGRLESDDVEMAVTETLQLLKHRFALGVPEFLAAASPEERRAYCYQALHRPMRVCGMVRNQGEPGGGPFWVNTQVQSKADEPLYLSAITPQIVESAQVNTANLAQKQRLTQATHFNPVDFVCSLRDHRGIPYELSAYADAKAWFLAHKPKDGKVITVLERPGLWNGAMAHWLTLFMEIPVSLFNPVKTIADLLRPAHLG
jgi:hypothetical protein